MAKISFWTGEGALFSVVYMLADAFAIANLWHRTLTGDDVPLFEIQIVTTDGEALDTGRGAVIQPDGGICDIDKTDVVIFAPILPNINPMPDNLDLLRESTCHLKENGSIIATVCTGAFILAEMGLLDGRKATTNWQFASMFRRRYPQVLLEPECMLTEDDGIICTGAVTAAYSLFLYIVKMFGSEKLALMCSKALLLDGNRESQQPYAVSLPYKKHGDEQVLKAQQMIEENYPEIDTIDSIARDVGISKRHFIRRFKKATGELPMKYLQRVRIESAKEKLETTMLPVDEITWSVGYQDISSFSRLFKQHTKISPRAYREKFSSHSQPA